MNKNLISKTLVAISIINTFICSLMFVQNYNPFISSTPVLITIIVLLAVGTIANSALSFIFWSQFEENIAVNLSVFVSTFIVSSFFLVSGLHGDFSQIVIFFLIAIVGFVLSALSLSKLIYAIILNVKGKKTVK